MKRGDDSKYYYWEGKGVFIGIKQIDLEQSRN